MLRLLLVLSCFDEKPTAIAKTIMECNLQQLNNHTSCIKAPISAGVRLWNSFTSILNLCACKFYDGALNQNPYVDTLSRTIAQHILKHTGQGMAREAQPPATTAPAPRRLQRTW